MSTERLILGKSERRVRRDLRLSATDAMFFSVMVGCGEAYFVAFALAMGMGAALAGLLSTLPMLAGALLQLAGPWAVNRLGSHKKWVVLTAGLQCISFIPMIVMALMGRMPAWLMFMSVGIYWALNLGGGPAWNTWIGTVVPKSIRARYLSSRARLAQLVLLVSLVGAGLLLHWGKESLGGGEHPRYLAVFAGLFALAGVARLGSTWCHTRISEPTPMPTGSRRVPFKAFLRGPKAVSGGRLLMYMLGLQLCVQVSGPFFAPYMLGALNFDYTVFAGLMCCSFLGRVLAMPLIGRFAKRYGPGNLLWVGGIGILPLSALWVVSPAPIYLVFVQLASGVMWASYEMATMLLLLETIPANERTSVLTTQSALNAVVIVVGSSCGALVFKLMGGGMDAYHTLFIASGVLRVGTVLLLARVHMPTVWRMRPILFRTLSVRPQFGGFDRPVISSIDDDTTNTDSGK